MFSMNPLVKLYRVHLTDSTTNYFNWIMTSISVCFSHKAIIWHKFGCMNHNYDAFMVLPGLFWNSKASVPITCNCMGKIAWKKVNQHGLQNFLCVCVAQMKESLDRLGDEKHLQIEFFCVKWHQPNSSLPAACVILLFTIVVWNGQCKRGVSQHFHYN